MSLSATVSDNRTIQQCEHRVGQEGVLSPVSLLVSRLHTEIVEECTSRLALPLDVLLLLIVGEALYPDPGHDSNNN
jgi:hypothetical protein